MSFGIEAIELYVPNTYVEQTELGTTVDISETHNQVSKGKYTLGLGQHQLSFAYPFEDVNSIALTGIYGLTQLSTISSENTTSAPLRLADSRLAPKHLQTSPNPPKPCSCLFSRDITTLKVFLVTFRSHQRQRMLWSYKCSFKHAQLDQLSFLGRPLRHCGGSWRGCLWGWACKTDRRSWSSGDAYKQQTQDLLLSHKINLHRSPVWLLQASPRYL